MYVWRCDNNVCVCPSVLATVDDNLGTYGNQLGVPAVQQVSVCQSFLVVRPFGCCDDVVDAMQGRQLYRMGAPKNCGVSRN